MSKVNSSFLSNLTTKTTEKKQAFFFYGKPNIGKTLLAAQFPKVCFVQDGFDDGIGDHQRSGAVSKSIAKYNEPVKSWEHLLRLTRELAEEPDLDQHISWVCFDGLSGLQEHCWKARTDKDYDGDRSKFLAWGEQGAKACEADFFEWTQVLDRVCARGIGVIILAHHKTKPDKNPLGDTFDTIVPDVHYSTFNAIKKWCPNIGYIQQVPLVKDPKAVTKKVHQKDWRVIHFAPTPTLEVKNRLGIEDPVEMGSSAAEAYANLQAAAAAGIAKIKSTQSN